MQRSAINRPRPAKGGRSESRSVKPGSGEGMATTAGILIIGSEVLSGKVTDENSPYLVRELRSLGVDVRRIVTIPDDIPVIVEAVQDMARDHDLVFTTGGVGPTHDDVTIAAIARAFNRRLVRHPLLEEALRRHYEAGITAAQLRMAEVPEGSRLLGVEDFQSAHRRVRERLHLPRHTGDGAAKVCAHPGAVSRGPVRLATDLPPLRRGRDRRGSLRDNRALPLTAARLLSHPPQSRPQRAA